MSLNEYWHVNVNMMKMSAHDVMAQLANNSMALIDMTQEERKKLQDVLLSMMKDIHNVCQTFGIHYALVGGSALGAVRHQGFIPWDDDMDIAMLRKDFEKFKVVFENHLGDRYILETPNFNQKDSKTVFGKIYKKGTSLWEIQDVSVPYPRGIYIDIFILENVSKWKIVRRFDAFISDFLRGIGTSVIFYKYPSKIMDSYFGSTLKTYVYYRCRQTLGLLFSFVSHKRIVDFYDTFVSRHKDSYLVTIPTGTKKYMGEMIPRSWWEPQCLAVFEDTFFYIPSNSDEYLRNLYGDDYMILPPVEKRDRHFCVKLDFGDGKQ